MPSPEVRLGVSTYAFPRTISRGVIGVDDVLAWAAEHRVTTVQFCENLPWPEDRTIPSGLLVETGTRGIGDHLLRHLDLARRQGLEFVRLVIDHESDEPSVDEAMLRLEPLAERFREAGVQIAIENHDRFRARELRRLVANLGLGVVFDSANSLGSLEDVHTVLGEVGPYVVNLHVKEVRAVRKPDMLGFDITGAVLGEGGIDWMGILGQLPALRSVTLEQWLPEEQELGAAEVGIERLRGWLSKSVEVNA